jgi:hypothetical protein
MWIREFLLGTGDAMPREAPDISSTISPFIAELFDTSTKEGFS